MTHKKIIFAVLIILTISNPIFCYADENIPCPGLDIIQQSQQKLDTAIKIQNSYIAYTASPVFQSDNLWWFVGVGNILANSAEEVVANGKIILDHANIKVDVYATKVENEFICHYEPGFIQARGKKFSLNE